LKACHLFDDKPNMPSWAKAAARLTTLGALLGWLVSFCAAERYTFRYYTQTDGLRNLSVNCLVRDRTGFLWVGTESGLFRYDGFRFRPIGTPEINVHSLREDQALRLWIGSIDGLYYLDGSRWDEVRQGSQHLEMGSPASIQFTPDGQLVVLSRHELLAVSSPDHGLNWNVRPYFASRRWPGLDSISSVLIDKSGQLWAGCGLEICRFAPGERRVWGEAQGLPHDHWRSLFVDSGGTVWARSQHGVYVLPGGSERFITRGLGPDPKAMSSIGLDFAEDAQGRIITPFPKGILRWEKDHWRAFTASNGFSTNEPSALMVDGENNVWIGIIGHGVAKWLGYGAWEGYTTNDGFPSDVVWGSARDLRGRVWAATEHGLAVKEAGQHAFRTWKRDLGTSGEHIRGFAAARDGGIWFGNKAGLVMRIDPDSAQFRRYQLSPVNNIFADPSGGVWISTADGLFLFPGDGGLPAKVHCDSFNGERVTNVTKDQQGRLWAAAGTKIVRLGPSSWSLIETRTRIPARISTIVAARDGSVWLAGWFSGLIRLRNLGQPSESAETYTEDALFSNNVYFLGEDRRGRIWAGTDSGVSVFNGAKWSHLTTDDGLIWNDSDENAFRADSDGSVWIGTSGGMSQVTDIDEALKSRDLRIVIESATFGQHALGQASSVKWAQTPFMVTLAADSLRNEHALAFRYRLSGVDRDFVRTDKNELRYPGLEPGDYEFDVQSVDTSRSIRSPIVRLEFRLEPPWWRTSLFYAGMGILAVAALSAIWWWRHRILVQQKNRLEQVVLERTRSLNDRTRELEKEKQELLIARETLHRQATHDGLTALWNRVAILEILGRELERSRREGTCTAVVLADIDQFKKINDAYGHLAGDAVLKNFAMRLTNAVRSYDSVGRYGGEEFLIVMVNWIPADNLERIERLRAEINGSRFQADGVPISVTCSFGVSWAETEAIAVEDLLRLADRALYRSKSLGRNRVECELWNQRPDYSATTVC
jgi:diguanylate cyclase (GGDEF)-like protein